MTQSDTTSASELRFNFEYFRMYKEVWYFFLLRFYFQRLPKNESANRHLIVVPCLIGEFVAAIPAIRDFVVRHPDCTVDLVVIAPVRELAQHIKGIGHVYVVDSVHKKYVPTENNENVTENTTGAEKIKKFYNEIHVLRMSHSAYHFIKNTQAKKIKAHGARFAFFGLYLFFCTCFRKKPKQWRDVNFEMLGGKSTGNMPDIHDVLDLQKSVSLSLSPSSKLEQVITSGRTTILIHTGASWPMKHWSAQNWIETLTQIHELGAVDFIFIGGGKQDEKDFAEISAALNFPVQSLIGKINLFELAQLMTRTNYFIGIDSGPQNLAQLASMKGVVIFGPGPHIYLPDGVRLKILDKSCGRGITQMYFAKKSSTKKGYIDQITPVEVVAAFREIFPSK